MRARARVRPDSSSSAALNWAFFGWSDSAAGKLSGECGLRNSASVVGAAPFEDDFLSYLELAQKWPGGAAAVGLCLSGPSASFVTATPDDDAENFTVCAPRGMQTRSMGHRRRPSGVRSVGMQDTGERRERRKTNFPQHIAMVFLCNRGQVRSQL